jgi:hypothetical protein
MRRLFIRYCPIKGQHSEGMITEEPLPLNSGETVIGAWPIDEKTVALVLVYTEQSELRHTWREYPNGEGDSRTSVRGSTASTLAGGEPRFGREAHGGAR